MKKFFKIASLIVGIVILGVAGVMAYVKLALPNVGDAPDLKVEVTPDGDEF